MFFLMQSGSLDGFEPVHGSILAACWGKHIIEEKYLYKLSETEILQIENDSNNTEIFIIKGIKRQIVKVDNSCFLDNETRFVSLCKNCGKSYVFFIPDKSSTWGAVTVIIAYKNPKGWILKKLPFMATVEKLTNNSTSFVLNDGEKKYEFQKGKLLLIN